MLARRRFYYILILLIFVLAVSCSPTSSVDTPNTLISINKLLPLDQEIDSWSRKGDERLYGEDQLFTYINGGADSFIEYGFNQVITQVYESEGITVDVSIYEMSSPSAAFGIYSLQRDQNAPVLNIGDDGFQSDNVTAFWQDKYYTIIASFEAKPIPKKILYQFAKNISGKIGRESKPPKFLSRFPKIGLMPRSLIYIKGELGLAGIFYLSNNEKLLENTDFVGAGYGIYQFNNEKAHLVMIQYADAKETLQKKEMMLQVFAREYQDCLSDEFKAFKDKKERYYAARSADNILYIVFKSSSEDVAKKIFQQI